MRQGGGIFRIDAAIAASVVLAAIVAAVALPARHSTASVRSPRKHAATLPPSSAGKLEVAELFGKLPMTFEANRGQTDKRVKFLARGDGYTLFLANDGATLALRSSASASESPSPVPLRERGPTLKAERRKIDGGEGAGALATAASMELGLNRISLSETARRGYNWVGRSLDKSQTAAARAVKKKEKLLNEANFFNDYGRFSSKKLASFSRGGAIRSRPTTAKGWSRAEALSLSKGKPRETEGTRAGQNPHLRVTPLAKRTQAPRRAFLSRKGTGEGQEQLLRMTLVGANPHARIEGVDPLRAKANYFIGNNPKNWHTDVPRYAKVRYRNIYPGIDLVFYGGSSAAQPFPLPDRERSRGAALASFSKRRDAGVRDIGKKIISIAVPHLPVMALAGKDSKSHAGLPLPIRERSSKAAGEGSGSFATVASTRAGLNRISLSETARRGYNWAGRSLGKSQTAAPRAAKKKEKMPNEANFFNDYGHFSSKKLASFLRAGAIRSRPTPAKGWSRAEALSLSKGAPREAEGTPAGQNPHLRVTPLAKKTQAARRAVPSAGSGQALSRKRTGEGQEQVLRMKLVGANAHARIEGVDRLPGKSNYFIGNNPKNWHTDVPMYAKVRYRNIYPGIDLVFYGGSSAAQPLPLPDRERSRGAALASFSKRRDAGVRD
ncbi:MAG: hypothetical protein ACREQI_00470, partial [Candidatus Binataceae bacterium]